MNRKNQHDFLNFLIQDDEEGCKSVLKQHVKSPKKQLFLRFVNGAYVVQHNKKCSEQANVYLETLKKDSLWFSHPVTFNDPFDCLFNIDVFEDAFGEALKKSKEADFAPKTQVETERIKNIFRTRSYQIFNNHRNGNINFYPHSLICCFSEFSNLDSIRMWGHYANSHTGFCLCYEMKDLGTLSDDLFYPVVYQKQIKLTLENNRKNAVTRMLIKSNEWSYEKEWRIIKGNPNNVTGLAFDNIKPKAVYIGCKASDALKTDLALICKEKKIDLYQMNIKPGTFSLYPTPIDLKEIYQ